jgi:phosphoglucosamine mutase
MFGTDGVRDIANRGLMTPETALSLGRAFVVFLAERGAYRPKILVCRDTRRSGAMLESALCAGMMSAGADMYLLGVFPTPGISCVLRNGGFDAGAVISASHNPAEYNGVKFFNALGQKLKDGEEAEIESYLDGDIPRNRRPTGASVGDMRDASYLREIYLSWLKELMSSVGTRDWPLVVDAANGAACAVAREVFDGWGAPVTYCGVDPDGLNINDGVGVIHMDSLARAVAENRARLGIAFDGDADRVLMCDSKGRPIDGDMMLWVIARDMYGAGKLRYGVVATVMSNMILEEFLAREGIKMCRGPVGDRYVFEKMLETGALLGGEQSGHIIMMEHAGTGDGISAGLMFLKACASLGEDIDTLVDRFPRYPQILENIKIGDRERVLSSPALADATRIAEERMAGRGRVLIRSSGTEPLVRILVESRDADLTREICADLKRVLAEIGSPKSPAERKTGALPPGASIL